MLDLRVLDGGTMLDAATLVAREQRAARARRVWLPAVYTEADHCRVALEQLLADGYAGFVAYDDGDCVGVMCGRTADAVGFVPAHGLALGLDLGDSTSIVVRLFAELAPLLVRGGALRFTIDHIDLDPVGAALSNVGFGRGSVFASQPARPTDAGSDVEVRLGTSDDLDAIAELSQLELTHRSTPPIFAHPVVRTLTEARAEHQQLLEAGAVHFLARRENRDVGLVTVELTSPAPRLCPDAQPYIGATAVDPSVRSRGIGRALVGAALEWAHTRGYETVSVDFDSPNPLSRPFWLGMGFQPSGYRLRRSIDASYSGRSSATLRAPIDALSHRS